VIPREGVESRYSFSYRYTAFPSVVIPREGVERRNLPQLEISPHTSSPVIPREGVESIHPIE